MTQPLWDGGTTGRIALNSSLPAGDGVGEEIEKYLGIFLGDNHDFQILDPSNKKADYRE